MSFLRNYKTFTDGNEAHPMYHMWCSLVALSSIVSRRVSIPMGYFPVHANLYVVLDGPPGDRKTTAMSVCKTLLREVGGIPFSAECQTKESLVREWSQYAQSFERLGEAPEIYTPITICVTELSQFIGANSASMIDFLTTVYDAPIYDAKTKNKGNDVIQGPYVTLLGCTTPAWITARMRDDVISGGFSRRAIFVYWPGERRRIPFPEITDAQKQAWSSVVSYSQELKKVSGTFKWTEDARKFFSEWYTNLRIPQDPLTAGYYESKHMQLMKVAMLVSLSESTDLVLEKNHLELTLDLLSDTEKNLEKVFQGIGRNELNAVASKIMEVLKSSKGSMPEKELNLLMHRDASSQELYNVMRMLQQTDQIVIADTKDSNGVVRRKVMTKSYFDSISKPAASSLGV